MDESILPNQPKLVSIIFPNIFLAVFPGMELRGSVQERERLLQECALLPRRGPAAGSCSLQLRFFCGGVGLSRRIMVTDTDDHRCGSLDFYTFFP